MKDKIHFLYEEGKEPNTSFATALIKDLEQTDLDKADTVVSIGGDGLLMQALRRAPGKKVCGILAPNSNSAGFWTNKGIDSASKLSDILNRAARYPVKPLKAEITFADGSTTTRRGYNDLSISGVHKPLDPALRQQFDIEEIDVSIQSVLLNLKISFDAASIGPFRIMGSGLIFATPFGSTAMNRNYGGASADIRSDTIMLTGMGIAEPRKGFNSVANPGNAVFDIALSSPDKRPVKLTFDSFGLVNNDKGSPIANIRISSDTEKTAHLVLADDPGTRAYSAMMG
ncbi:MAG: hypothetical protein LRY54_04840 [Alphaproteobacteria bacterium]|nr:hypothetical protein [Alphaproteobacteria bacterium]